MLLFSKNNIYKIKNNNEKGKKKGFEGINSVQRYKGDMPNCLKHTHNGIKQNHQSICLTICGF